MKIGKRLKDARVKKGLTQDQLGQALGGLTGPTISAIENGTAKSFRNPELLLQAAQILEVSPIWLQFGLGDAELVTETIPLISWDEVFLPAIKRQIIRRIGTTVPVSKEAFALKVSGNSMVAPSGNEISFREGMIVIVDPEPEIKPNSYVIASVNKTVILRKYVKEGNKEYLQPLNQLFSQVEANKKTKFHGVVKATLQEEFEK